MAAADKRTFDPVKIRRVLLWGAPLYLGLIIAMVFLIQLELIPSVEDLLNQAPNVRITPGLILTPVGIPLFAVMLIGGFMRAIPVDERYTRGLERIFLFPLFYAEMALFAVVLSSPLIQTIAMPAMGYTRCNILKDHPNLYFSDWLKDPDLCVRGMSREWVREQAASRNKNAGSPAASGAL